MSLVRISDAKLDDWAARWPSILPTSVPHEQVLMLIADLLDCRALLAERTREVEEARVDSQKLVDALNDIREEIGEFDPEKCTDVRPVHIPMEPTDYDCFGEGCAECAKGAVIEIIDKALARGGPANG